MLHHALYISGPNRKFTTMKKMKLIFLLFFLSSLVLVTSCGDDDGDVDTNLGDIEFTFDSSNPPVDQALINNLNNSGDPNGIQIAGNLSIANLMTIWLSYFNQPAGAVETNAPIGTCGGDAVVYTYSGSSGSETITVAYQICETNSNYTFQVFFSQNGSDFDLLMYGEESKSDLRSGYLEIYAADPSTSEPSSDVVLRYNWEESSDGSFEYIVTDDSDDFRLTINLSDDNSGELSITEIGRASCRERV